MAPRKSERILNLTICLLASRRFVTREQIRQVVEGYRGLSDAAFERTFERDKDELRALGVPIETGSNSPLFEDEVGYRIRRSDFELPPIELDADEAAVVALAAQSWQQSRLASSAQSAWAKLRAAGVETDATRITTMSPTVVAREAAFEVLWQAVLSRSVVRFGYRRPPGSPSTRTLQPWGVTSHRGRWYVIGHDTDRGAPRMFKMSRVVGQPEVVAGPEAFEVPADVDVRALARSLDPAPATGTAVVAVRADRAPRLRRRGEEAPDHPLPDAVPAGFTAYRVGYADEGSFVAEVASFGPDVLVLEPATVRRRVLQHLAGVAGTGDAALATATGAAGGA